MLHQSEDEITIDEARARGFVVDDYNSVPAFEAGKTRADVLTFARQGASDAR